VEYYPLIDPAPAAFSRAAEALRPIVVRYLRLLAQTTKMQINLEKIPEDKFLFTYSASSLLQVPPDAKQELLSIENALSLVERLRSIYLRETAILRSILGHSSSGEENNFSRN
jgi:hypothetical protein